MTKRIMENIECLERFMETVGDALAVQRDAEKSHATN